ncbi:anthranilate synthase component I [Methylomarinovum tepidoasis]|uniref:Anthranilate synthase component 1 n=1 Tax=Methylomarinovum tepidoasis TaxID=2840183 RepID=A0AAU9C764_9GAMM|nr:anthranilate synthase component I [Methylomarinovum sp. IN45]BCX89442.1 anthranilate synthase component I [Methylomarinovum sp. IN45]
MTPQRFRQLADQGYNRIPVRRQVLADLDTPLSAYLKLAARPYTYLFESVHGGEQWGRYSIIGLPARRVLKVFGRRIELWRGDERLEQVEADDPLAWIKDFAARYRVAPLEGLPRFSGGLVGYFGYETIAYIEPRLRQAIAGKPDPLATPDILLMESEDLLVFDNLSGTLELITHADPGEPSALERAEARLESWVERLRGSCPYPDSRMGGRIHESDFVSGFTREGFENAVRRVKDYIVEGDVMQVVLSQRLSIPFHGEPLSVYRALRCLNPSPYLYHLDLADFHIVGSSPEILVRLEDGAVTVRPIAGTRPRGATPEEDLALERDLLADPKELAEHLMLIDLGRNDVGRVARIGSVEVTDRMIIERYSHVMHIVSNVVGRLRPQLDAFDVLRATFPAGTVSGAPKIRAMEIIAELEPVKRGIYSGAVGYIGWSGNLDTAIAIRTAVIKDRQLHVQAGAGIVHDSVPEKEWEETMNKGRALFRAVARAAEGLS